MNEKHTPEPWYELNTGNHQGLIISEITTDNVAVTYAKKDARRIVAAVNACRGIGTEALEAGVVKDLIKSARAVLDLLLSGDMVNQYEGGRLQSALAKLEGR